MNYALLTSLFFFLNCNSSEELNNEAMAHTGKFIMTPEHKEASFNIDFKENSISIQQGANKTNISLQQLYEYEDYYAAPKGRKLIENKTGVIHISKNVFNADDAIEVLIQAAFNPPKDDNSKPFIIDFLLKEDGTVSLLGSTYIKTGQGSDPVFAIVDDKAYYGVYDDRNLGNFLKDYQKLNTAPNVTNTRFTNGTMVYRKSNWDYSKQKGLSIEETIEAKKDFIDKLIGPKEEVLTVDHSITFYDMDYKPSTTEKIKVKMVGTYGDRHFNSRGIRSLMEDLGKCNSKKIVPVLMEYLEDNRNIDLPGDDYGSTSISILAQTALADIFIDKPEHFIDYTDEYISKDGLAKWWKRSKQHYN